MFICREKLRHNAALVQVPIGKEANFKGVIDLVHEKVYHFDDPTGLFIFFVKIIKFFIDF